MPYWKRAVVAIIFMVAYALSSGALAYAIGPAMELIFTGGQSSDTSIIPFASLDFIEIPKELVAKVVPLALIVIVLFKSICSLGNTYFMSTMGIHVTRDIRNILYKHVLHLPVGFFSNNASGSLAMRIGSDVALLKQAVATTIPVAFKEGSTVIVLAAIVINTDWQLAVAAFVGFPLIIYPMAKMGKKMKRVTKRSQELLASVGGLIFEALAGIRIVKAFGMEEHESNRYYTYSQRMAKLQIREMLIRAISAPVMEIISTIGLAITIWYASVRIGSGSLEPKEFITFFAAVVMMYKPVKSLNGVNLNIQQSIAAGERVFELLDTQIEEGYTKEAKPLDVIKDSIEFKNISFSYGDKKIIEDLSLKVNKGETVAIVGLSGSGKSTLVNLIPRFYDVSSGSIEIDGVNIKDVSLVSLRKQLSLISQHIVLFNDSIASNISYGDTDKTTKDLENAAKASNSYNFISKLSKGFDTEIGQGGVKLSGGERQRVSIARAFLKDTPTLIMDEATSSLDTESEREVQKGFENLMKDRTVFVIAHRLSTIINADKIVVLSKGKIKESGTHEELLKIGGEYSRLYEMQFKDKDSE